MLGKIVFNNCYWHISLTKKQPVSIQEAIKLAENISGISEGEHYNIVKYSLVNDKISLLNYPDFFNEPFPVLEYSWKILLTTERIDKRTYKNSLNPPILHRKELFLSADHPRQDEYKSLTASAEDLGLFKNKTKIGYQRAWNDLISSIGYQLDGHQLVPIGNNLESDLMSSVDIDDVVVERHKTAMSRSNLSAPIQFLTRHGFLDGELTIFDYGCGRGDDLRNLKENDINVCGWDPHFLPECSKVPSDLVNLGFVINVIEDEDERREALQGAYELANKLLVVSVMLYNQKSNKGQHYNDGIITSRNTFQKYFTQAEIKQYIDLTLSVDSIPIAPGILFVFSDNEYEQSFLQNRQRSRSNYLRLTSRPSPILKSSIRAQNKQAKFELAQNAVKSLKNHWLELGRKPEKSEVSNLVEITQIFGTYNKAIKFLESETDPVIFEQARQNRIDDILTYLAFQIFSKRKPFRYMNSTLQRDIKIFFGDYTNAVNISTELIYQLGDTTVIEEACLRSSEEGIGYYDVQRSLQVPTDLIERLPVLLRLYVSCASVFYGDVSTADLIKIHVYSGKLSLMIFDDFIGSPLPLLLERVKINFRHQDFDVFEYGEEYEPTYLYLKSKYLNEEYPGYAEQLEFDEKLLSLNIFEFENYGPKPDVFRKNLSNERLSVSGFDLIPSQIIPDLDDKCGLYFTYRQFIECGETWAKTKIDNLPQKPDSYNALFTLAKEILDPVINYYGMVELTYGFCSAKLAKAIPGRIAPKLDQHSAHELNRLKNPICSRLGAACDFIVSDEDMLEVAQWVVENTPFDRLYFYGNDKPIHVSIGPEEKGKIVVMRPGKIRLIPSVIKKDKFMKL